MSRHRVLRLGRFSVRFMPSRLAILLALFLCLMLVALWSLTAGSRHIPTSALWSLFTPANTDAAMTDALVVLDFRLSRLALAMVAGAMLGIAGAIMQATTRNGLADPGLLGVHEGASLAVLGCLFLLPSLPVMLRPVAGIAGGMASAAIVLMLSGATSRLRFVLTGIGFSWFLSALLLILMASLDIRNLQTAMIWMAGNLQGASWTAVSILSVILVIALGLLLLTARAADVQALGDHAATALGVHSRILSVLHVTLAVSLTASCVSFTGSIGFVGLIGPHIARLLLPGGSYPGVVMGAGLTGAILVAVSDTIARTAFSPLELPTGLVLSAVGAPTLLALLWFHRHRL
ncbi:FecCD family ABC transporter permease [Agrobacterium tumefaciens]|uniref:FecCD family ABC transporter permease n=1 Tax=Agrobacterium tumefaciens TaxID=358 RepID=UPI001572191C|nr:iron ABC transporter permease [Agrobacterium tumefaciens]NTE37380.1 iron ABC transporter permease [Agrobacterium tumefaciens]NTE52889.1 iron ABC transporter permease [Agrobacterium tumefaciens]